jgi:hypothetical protein
MEVWKVMNMGETTLSKFGEKYAVNYSTFIVIGASFIRLKAICHSKMNCYAPTHIVYKAHVLLSYVVPIL